MISSYTWRHSGNAAARMSRGVLRTSVRFSSSKKDSKPDPQAPSPPKKLASINKEKAKEEPAQKQSSPKRLAQNYIAFKDLPKPSPELQNMSTEQFHARLHMTEVPEKGLPKHEALMPFQGYKYDFNLHPGQRLAARRGPLGASKNTSGIEPNLALLGLIVDADTLSSGMDEHPLRESITGMCVLNPLFKEVKNRTLWDLFPENKKYGGSPFGKDASFNAFKQWEDQKNGKLQDAAEKTQKEEKEFRDFCKNLQESKSFVRKAKTESKEKETAAEKSKKSDDEKTAKAQSTPSAAVTHGRRKLDRGLLKQYRKYKKEQYAKAAKDNNDNENENNKDE